MGIQYFRFTITFYYNIVYFKFLSTFFKVTLPIQILHQGSWWGGREAIPALLKTRSQTKHLPLNSYTITVIMIITITMLCNKNEWYSNFLFTASIILYAIRQFIQLKKNNTNDRTAMFINIIHYSFVGTE